MSEDSDEAGVRPLPRDWLPARQPPEGAAVWAAKVERVMAAATPELQRRSNRRSRVMPTPWSVMARWWKPAAALAAAALALLFGLGEPAGRPALPARSIPLNLVASDGDPVTLWEAVGIQAHPVLALIALQAQENLPRPTIPEAAPKKERPQ